MAQQTLYPNRQDAAFVRLHALVQKGYRAELGVKSDTRFIGLEHPRGVDGGAPSLTLCPDGLIMGIDNIHPLNRGEGDPNCVYASSAEDWLLFQSFLSELPEPTTWQAVNAMTISEARGWIYIYTLLAFWSAIFVGLLLGMLSLATWLWHLHRP